MAIIPLSCRSSRRIELTFSQYSSRLVRYGVEANVIVLRDSCVDLYLVKLGHELRNVVRKSHVCYNSLIDKQRSFEGVVYSQETYLQRKHRSVTAGYLYALGVKETNTVQLTLGNRSHWPLHDILSIYNRSHENRTRKGIASEAAVYGFKYGFVDVDQAFECVDGVCASSRHCERCACVWKKKDTPCVLHKFLIDSLNVIERG